MQTHENIIPQPSRLQPLAHSVNEVAELLGLSRVSIYKFMNDGRIRSFKVGSRTLILRTEVDAFLNGAMLQSAQGSKNHARSV